MGRVYPLVSQSSSSPSRHHLCPNVDRTSKSSHLRFLRALEPQSHLWTTATRRTVFIFIAFAPGRILSLRRVISTVSMSAVCGPIMSHGFQPHYVSRASQQDQHGVLAFSGPPQAPSRRLEFSLIQAINCWLGLWLTVGSSVPGSQVHYSLEPASGGFSRAPLGVHTRYHMLLLVVGLHGLWRVLIPSKSSLCPSRRRFSVTWTDLDDDAQIPSRSGS